MIALIALESTEGTTGISVSVDRDEDADADAVKEVAKEKADEVLKNNSVNAIYSSHIADAGSDQQEMEKNYYMVDRENTFLQYLNRALDMLDAGTFGICTSCGKLINKERLMEVPHTSSCFDCKSKSV